MDNTSQIISNQEKLMLSVQEQIWAHKFHDSIRGLKGVNEVSYFIGNWAGNYTFFYLLSRLMQEFRFERILELGLGESSKFITTFLNTQHTPDHVKHDVFEQNEAFAQHFKSKSELCKNTHIHIIDLIEEDILGYTNKVFNLNNVAINDYDFYVIDGPIGSPRYSRFDVMKLVKHKVPGSEFVILFDDVNREGEMDTLKYLMGWFNQQNIEADYHIYSGEKSVAVLTTPKYKWALSY